MGAPPGFQVWAPSPLIWVCASRASGERWGCFSSFTVQGLRSEGLQGPGLLWRVLQLAAECLYFLFLFEKFFLFKPPWSKQAPGCSQLSLALSQESCSNPGARAGVSAALVPALVPGTLLSLSTLLTIRSFNVLYLWSLFFIYAGILLAVRSAPQIS